MYYGEKIFVENSFPPNLVVNVFFFFSSSHLHKRDGDLLETRPRLI